MHGVFKYLCFPISSKSHVKGLGFTCRQQNLKPNKQLKPQLVFTNDAK